MDRSGEGVERALARSRLAAAELDRRRREAPAPGDLFVCRATRDFPVEWLVVERDRRRPERLLVLLADASPILGSGDLAVPATAGSGRLSLRCRFGAWIAAGDLDPELRSGVVGADVVARALHRHRELNQEPIDHQTSEHGADREYQDWVEEIVAPAHAALTAAMDGHATAAAVVASGERSEARLPPPPRSWLYPLAAAILLLIAIGAGAALLWQRRELGRLVQESQLLRGALRHKEAGARAARAEAERYRGEIERTAATRRGDQQRIAALGREADTSGQSPGLLTNLPFLLLQPRETERGTPIAIPRPARSPYLLLLIELATDPGPPYRLEISHQGQPGGVWKIGGLERTGPSELTVAVPSRWLQPGDYGLRLYARDSTTPFREYTLAVRPD